MEPESANPGLLYLHVADGILYAQNVNGEVLALAAGTGEPLGRIWLGNFYARRSYAVYGGVLYAGYDLEDIGVWALDIGAQAGIGDPPG